LIFTNFVGQSIKADRMRELFNGFQEIRSVDSQTDACIEHLLGCRCRTEPLLFAGILWGARHDLFGDLPSPKCLHDAGGFDELTEEVGRIELTNGSAEDQTLNVKSLAPDQLIRRHTKKEFDSLATRHVRPGRTSGTASNVRKHQAVVLKESGADFNELHGIAVPL
jgi:hypothetical protein